MKTLEKAQAEIKAGRLWRAKEILRGAVGQREYDVELYRRYGELLLTLGDLPEAGKYLFLSGSTAADHQEAIALFLGRWGQNGPNLLYSRFPSRARLASVRDYPHPVRQVLSEGFKPPSGLVRHPVGSPHQPGGCREAIALWGCGLALFVILFLVAFGLYGVVKALS